MGTWRDNLVNVKQTPEERRNKYKLAREFGADPSWAARMRDFHSPKIFRWAGKPVPSIAERRTMGLLNSLDNFIAKMEDKLSKNMVE